MTKIVLSRAWRSKPTARNVTLLESHYEEGTAKREREELKGELFLQTRTREIPFRWKRSSLQSWTTKVQHLQKLCCMASQLVYIVQQYDAYQRLLRTDLRTDALA